MFPPRRVWDFYSNRVVPWWVARKWPKAISHAWVEEGDRLDVLTPINGYEWPVLIPKDANLDLIRIKILNAGAEYAWLDVLCLRQVGGRREDLRAKEWKVDVPTIGRVYKGFEPVVYYFNGLGRPLRIKTGDFESDRNWFKRVWKLQVFSRDRIIGGDTGNGNAMTEEARAAFHRQLLSLDKICSNGRPDVFITLSYTQHRVCTSPVDKIAGMVYLLGRVQAIPAYYEMQSIEDAWTALVNVLWHKERAALFFAYPKPGDGNKVWRPSWSQVMDKAEVLPSQPNRLLASVKRTKDTDSDWIEARCMESGYVQGFAEGSQDGNRRHGELIVTHDAGGRHTFKIVADHEYCIPDGPYTLMGSDPYCDGTFHVQYWVVGRRLPEQKFEKVSVFYIPDKNEVMRLYYLKIARKAEIFLA